MNDDTLQQAAKVNDKGSFKIPFDEALDDALVSKHEKNETFINKVYGDKELETLFKALMLDRVYEKLTGLTLGDQG